MGRYCFLLSSLLFITLAMTILQRPLLWLLGVVPDDAFYYLQIARNLASTGNSTFDGINPTNGYHPLWMILLAPLADIFTDRELLLRAALGLSLLLHIGVSLLLVQLLRHLVGRFWGWLSGALWLINPLPISLALYGMETGVYLVALLLLLLVATRRGLLTMERGMVLSSATLAMIGGLLGLLFWSRTDGLILAAVTLSYIGWIAWPEDSATGSSRRPANALRSLLVAGSAFLLAILPWLVFSLLTFGGITQDSGAMKLLWGAAEHQGEGPLERAGAVVGYVYEKWLSTPLGLAAGAGSSFGRRVPVLPLLVALLLYVGVTRLPPTLRRARLIRLTVWLLTGVVATATAYGLFVADPQLWHLGLPGAVLFVIAYCWGALLLRRASAQGQLVRGAILFAIALVLVGKFWLSPPAPYPWQRDVYNSAKKFEPILPEGAVIGCFNAGIPAYFSNRRIINLDGLVNSRARRAWEEHRFERYLSDEGIDYIIDERDALQRAERFSSRLPSMTPMDSVALTGWSSGWRILWRVERPER